MDNSFKKYRTSLVLFLFAFVFKTALVLSFSSNPLFQPLLPGYDMTVFHNWALRIVGGVFSEGKAFYQAPLYPYLLALIYYLSGGPSVLAATVFNAALGAGSVVLVYLIGRRLFGFAVGVTAALIITFTPVILFYEWFLLRAPLVTFLNLLFLWSLLRYDGGRPLKSAAISGAVLGFAALGRANILVMLPVGAIWFYLQTGGGKFTPAKFKAAVFFILITFAAISPATIHNYVTGGRFVLVSDNAAENWKIGNSYDSSGFFSYPKEKKIPISDPAFWKLQLKKLGMLLSDYEQPNNINIYQMSDYQPYIGLPLPGWGVYLSFAVVGIILSASLWQSLWPLYAYLALYGLSISAFFVTSRFRVPLWPVLILFSALSLVDIVVMFRTRRMKTAITFFAVALIASWLLVADNQRTVQPAYNFNLSKAAEKSGDLKTATDELAKFAEKVPGQRGDAYLKMTLLFNQASDKEKAYESAQKALKESPDNVFALRYAGELAFMLGDRKAARKYLSRFLAVETDSLKVADIMRFMQTNNLLDSSKENTD